jgi:protein arginine kinase activator
MTCELCGEHEAVVHIQQIVGDDVYDLHLCEGCAKDKGISSKADKIELTLSEILTGLLDDEQMSASKRAALECPNCGKKYDDFRKEGTLGCVECYNTFGLEIKTLLKNMGGKIRHTGKYPAKLKMYKTLLIDKEVLKQNLKEAVKNENYEEAAALRDRLNEIESASAEVTSAGDGDV